MTSNLPSDAMVLIVEPSLMRATALHNACSQTGLKTMVVRDLPTALLMISQHIFDACVLASNISELSDGWSLAAVCRLLFPHAYLCVVAGDRTVLTLQSAINSGANDVFENHSTPEQIVNAALSGLPQRTSDDALRHMN